MLCWCYYGRCRHRLEGHLRGSYSRSPRAANSGAPLSLIPISQSVQTAVSASICLHERFKLTAVDDGDGHQNTSTTSNSTHQICGHRKQSEHRATERGSSGNDTLEFLVHGPFTMTCHDLERDEKMK